MPPIQVKSQELSPETIEREDRQVTVDWDVSAVRSQFPALRRTQNGKQVAFFDGPAGSQVPQSVVDAVSGYLLNTNANHGAAHATSRESDAILDSAHGVIADFLGTPDPATVTFGANMTTLTLALSRTLSQRWNSGDEIIVSRLDHDANFTPWILAAQDAGATVRYIDLDPDDFTLNLRDFRSKLSEKTKLVAVGYASNATGTINPVKEIVQAAQAVDAQTFVDAVHYAPHGRIDVGDIGCDFLACSAYKFFGPHVGILYGKRHLLEEIRPYKLRPSTDDLPGKWMTGTQNHEGIAGAAAAVEYLCSLDAGASNEAHSADPNASERCKQLDRVFCRINDYEKQLSRQFLTEIRTIPGLKVWGISSLDHLSDRVPTFSMTFDRHSPAVVAERLADNGIYSWAGNHYALPFTEAAGLEPEGTLRIGALHYNTPQEIERVAECLRTIIE